MLQLIALNGDKQGQTIKLKEGLKFGSSEDCDFQLISDSIGENTFLIECDNSGMFSIFNPDKKSLLSNGTENLPRLDLIPGMIFSIGDIGFSIQEVEDLEEENSEEAQEQTSFAEAFQTLSPSQPQTFQLSSQKITFKFVRGLWLNQEWHIPWLPMTFGTQSPVFFFQDPTIPSHLDFLTISQNKEKKITLSSDISDFVRINSFPLSAPQPLVSGDLVEFANTAFYIELK